MRMFQSVSGHSSEQNIARYSSRPAVSQRKGVSDTISDWFENHQPQRTQISTVNNAPFIQYSNQMASRLTTSASFPSVVFQLLQFSRQLPSFSAHRAALMAKTDLSFPVFSIIFVDFAVQFCFRCKFSFHEKATFESSLTVAWFSWTNHKSLLRIATNEIAAFCMTMDHVKCFFSSAPKWATALAKAGFLNEKKLYM